MAIKIIQAVPKAKLSTAKKPKMMVGQGAIGGLNIMTSQNAASTDTTAVFWNTIANKAHSYYGFVDTTAWLNPAVAAEQTKALCDLTNVSSGVLTHVVGPAVSSGMTASSYTEFVVTADGVPYTYRQYCGGPTAYRAVLGMVENGQAQSQSASNRMFGYSQGSHLWLNQREDCIKLGMYIPFKSSIKVEVTVFGGSVTANTEYMKCGCTLMTMDLEGLDV